MKPSYGGTLQQAIAGWALRWRWGKKGEGKKVLQSTDPNLKGHSLQGPGLAGSGGSFLSVPEPGGLVLPHGCGIRCASNPNVKSYIKKSNPEMTPEVP